MYYKICVKYREKYITLSITYQEISSIFTSFAHGNKWRFNLTLKHYLALLLKVTGYDNVQFVREGYENLA